MKPLEPSLKDIKFLLGNLPNRNTDAESLNECTNLIDELGLTSIEITELLLSIEDHFQARLPLETLTLADLQATRALLAFIRRGAVRIDQ